MKPEPPGAVELRKKYVRRMAQSFAECSEESRRYGLCIKKYAAHELPLPVARRSRRPLESCHLRVVLESVVLSRGGGLEDRLILHSPDPAHHAPIVASRPLTSSSNLLLEPPPLPPLLPPQVYGRCREGGMPGGVRAVASMLQGGAYAREKGLVKVESRHSRFLPVLAI